MYAYHQLMNMHDHFTLAYCVTLAKQTVLEGGFIFSSSVQHEITVGKWCLIRVQTGIKENALIFTVKQTSFNHKCSC